MGDVVQIHRVRQLVHAGVRDAYVGQEWLVPCVLCDERFDARDGLEVPEGLICMVCARHPRFDVDCCPLCGAGWSETIQPCSGCGLTVQTYARMVRANGS